MSFEEFGEIIKSDETKDIGKELIENTIGALSADPIACKNLVQYIIKLPISLREQFFWNKFYRFLNGVYVPFDKTVAISQKLFGDEKSKRKNAMRIVEVIGKIETEDSLQFVINATRSVLLNLISTTDYFRIIKAIAYTLLEDLIFLSDNIIKGGQFRGNTQVLALERSGLMIMAGIDANEDVESQNYVFTSFGKMVDQYALSLEDDERFKWHNKTQKSGTLFDTGIEEISNEEIQNMVNRVMKEGET